jgi:hypothetical protein
MQSPPDTQAERLQWLADRSAIADLMAEYTRCIDSKDFAGQASLLADDGRLELPFASFDKQQMTTGEHTSLLERYGALQHTIGNPVIEIDADRATLRCNFHAVHVHGDPGRMGGSEHATVGGIYDVTLRREDGRWRLVTINTSFVWTAGELAHG